MTLRLNAPLADVAERASAAAPAADSRARILMCAPDHFAVDYVINPWMEDQIGRTQRTQARAQWENLRLHLAREAALAYVPSAPGLPDMVFTANAGLVIGETVVVTRFHAKERRPEEDLFRAWFERAGFSTAAWPDKVAFEGAGDALFDRARGLIWCGHGWRSSEEAPPLIERIFETRAVGLRLVDPRFYHLDTCLCPLPGGWLLYYPQAFDERSRDVIATLVPAEFRIELDEREAASFACNAIAIGDRIFLNACPPRLERRLREAGLSPVVTPLSEFVRAGGAAKCLTLELPPTRADLSSLRLK
ncbi:dimethylarginine dimethylaminohydrolase family protein [Methylocystis parvus]|uniref:arginine deiminase n=1 Tax=Methylocystis parvus TaxID=134 RepID=A0A6B8M3C7_9HYPH|nr:arginine deiminase-related protein [Methylocystis parvus]QGM96818.1 nitrate reductase [Methylocystis parvus]WBJ99304.1 arginine deiminase-related protein [Methylocystis parvus OBBP]